MDRRFYLQLDGKRIGYTEFEHADPPMGLVHGKIVFDNIGAPYELFRDHCIKYGVPINFDELDEQLIDTTVIPQLSFFLPDGGEFKGNGAAINGIGPDDFSIDFYGVPLALMKTQFEHHYINYYRKK